jgi:hypothetical protein
VCDFARHQELQRVLGAGVIAKVDQPLIDDFGTGFRPRCCYGGRRPARQ